MILGLDLSNFSGVPTPEQVQCWYDSGVRRVCIGLQNARIARLQQAACQRFEREYYVDIPGRDLTIPEQGSHVWVDIEVGCFQSKQDVVTEVGRLWAVGLQPCIYGNEPSIKPVLGNDETFAGLPLVYANYNAAAQPPNFNDFHPFNGWLRPYCWQYAGSTDLCGVNVDLDEWDIDESEDDLSDEEKRELGYRRAKAVLDHNLLAVYNVRYTGPDLAAVELLRKDDGSSTGVVIPVTQPEGESV